MQIRWKQCFTRPRGHNYPNHPPQPLPRRTERHSLHKASSPSSMANERALHELEPYEAPAWAKCLPNLPEQRYSLGLFPTPLHLWKLLDMPEGMQVFIKRDDLSGMQLSGNKVRKLEFLIAEALCEGSDTVVTVGGIQSNHCRATAVAARYAGLDAHLVLRNSQQLADSDPGLIGNLLVERLVGAHVHQVTKEEYVKHGAAALGKKVVDDLKSKGKHPSFIPVGGSNATGTWGYLDFMRELAEQTAGQPFTDIVMACGSGGTSAGIALGNHLSGYGAKVWAYGVCDDPEYFYDHIDGLFADLGVPKGVRAEELLTAVQAKGAGYAISQSGELEFITSIAEKTGVVLDPVYSGKALFGFIKDVNAEPQQWQGRRVLFLHTGGLLAMYDKIDQLLPLLEGTGRSHRLKME